MAEKVRVLQVIGAMNRGGAETIVMNLMRAIDRSRFQFDFLVHEQARCDYDEEIEALGGTIYRIPRYNGANYLQYRSACRRFFAEHPEVRVVHGHINSCAPIYLDEANKAGCATIVHAHSVKSSKFFHRNLYSFLIRKLPEISEEFLGCSLQAGIDRYGLGIAVGPHFHVMQNGIDLRRYDCDGEMHAVAKERLGYAADTPLVGHVGRLVPIKNHDFLFEVFAKAKEAVPNARLLLAGGGPEESRLKARAGELGIGDSVDFLGVRDDVPDLMKAFDAFAFTSLREGLPISVVEAQAAGLPCLVSDAVPRDILYLPTARQLDLTEGADAWAWELVTILENHAPRESGVDAVRAHGFDIHDVAAWMEDFYTTLAS